MCMCKEVTQPGKGGHTFRLLYVSRKKCGMLRICSAFVLLCFVLCKISSVRFCIPGKDSWNWYHPNQLTRSQRLDNEVMECLWLMFLHHNNMLQKSFKCWKGVSLSYGGASKSLLRIINMPLLASLVHTCVTHEIEICQVKNMWKVAKGHRALKY